jgi:hypothetical protein
MLDYPDLAVGRHSLYISSNVFADEEAFTMVARVNLDALEAGRGFALNYHVDSEQFSYKPVQGADRTGYFSAHHSDTKLSTLSWDEGSPLLFPHRTNHALNASIGYESFSNGIDWNDRTDDRLGGATKRGNELWLAWSEGRDICIARCEDEEDARFESFWPQPHVHVAVVDATSYRLVRDRFIHNPDFAIAYPSLATDSLGRVGMSFSYGGGGAGNASPAAGYLTDGEMFRQVTTSPAPGDQGDYFSLRPDWPDGRRLTGSGYVSEPPQNEDFPSSPRWLFFRYSR